MAQKKSTIAPSLESKIIEEARARAAVEADKVDTLLMDLGTKPLNAREYPDIAFIAIGIEPSDPKNDFPMVLDGSEDVMRLCMSKDTVDPRKLGILPAVADWNRPGKYFTKRVIGILVWEGDIGEPLQDFCWRRPNMDEMAAISAGRTPVTCMCDTCRDERGLYRETEAVRLTPEIQAKAVTRPDSK